MSTPVREEAVEAAVSVGVVGGLVLPDAQDEAQPGAAADADRVRVVVSSGACALVDVGSPGVVVAAAVGEDADGVAEVLGAGPAEAGDLLRRYESRRSTLPSLTLCARALRFRRTVKTEGRVPDERRRCAMSGTSAEKQVSNPRWRE